MDVGLVAVQSSLRAFTPILGVYLAPPLPFRRGVHDLDVPAQVCRKGGQALVAFVESEGSLRWAQVAQRQLQVIILSRRKGILLRFRLEIVNGVLSPRLLRPASRSGLSWPRGEMIYIIFANATYFLHLVPPLPLPIEDVIAGDALLQSIQKHLVLL